MIEYGTIEGNGHVPFVDSSAFFNRLSGMASLLTAWVSNPPLRYLGIADASGESVDPCGGIERVGLHRNAGAPCFEVQLLHRTFAGRNDGLRGSWEYRHDAETTGDPPNPRPRRVAVSRRFREQCFSFFARIGEWESQRSHMVTQRSDLILSSTSLDVAS